MWACNQKAVDKYSQQEKCRTVNTSTVDVVSSEPQLELELYDGCGFSRMFSCTFLPMPTIEAGHSGGKYNNEHVLHTDTAQLGRSC